MALWDHVRASGLPIRWESLLVGWGRHLVFVNDIQDYAADQLGKRADRDDLLLRIMDADPTNTWEVRDLMRALADQEGVSAGPPESL